jgi:hypothetical protein
MFMWALLGPELEDNPLGVITEVGGFRKKISG